MVLVLAGDSTELSTLLYKSKNAIFVSSSKRFTHKVMAFIRSLKIVNALAICTKRRVLIISSVAPSSYDLRTTSAHWHKCSTNSASAINGDRIFFSVLASGYSCSTVIGNRSKKASSRICDRYLPSSLPRPLVLAVATIVKPDFGYTISPDFLL